MGPSLLLQPAAAVEGVVLDPEKQPVPEALVVAEQNRYGGRGGVSDTDGRQWQAQARTAPGSPARVTM
jgi:hypothetical protein